MKSVAGTWRGMYRYELEDGASTQVREVGFTLELQQGWLGRLRGTIVDDPELGLPVSAAIEGRLRGLRLFFRKIPQEFYTLGKDGLRPVAEYVEQAFGEQVRGKPRAPHVHYHGQLEPAQMRVEGVWHIPSYLLPLRSSSKHLVFQETRGTWWMQRQSP